MDPTGAWSRAARATVDVYGSGAHCATTGGVTGAAAPTLTRSFAKPTALSFDVSPGHHVVVVTLFADNAAQLPLAGGCVERDFVGGSNACLQLTLEAIDPTACASDDDCVNRSAAAGSGATACCASHCVDLAQASLRNCGGGVCVDAATCCSDADCNAPPAAAACYLGGSCPAVGGTCSYTLRPGALTCGTTCCRDVEGTCNPDCSLSCSVGYADCDGDPSTGCEQSIFDTQHCGGCWTACSFANAVAACPTGSCTLSKCDAGFQNCDGQNANGCECKGTGCCANGACQTAHDDGVGQTFYDCVATGTYDQTQATEACAAFTGDASQCHVSTTCASGATAVCSAGSATACDCWIFAGTGVGKVKTNGAGSCTCHANGNPGSWD